MLRFKIQVKGDGKLQACVILRYSKISIKWEQKTVLQKPRFVLWIYELFQMC